MSKEAVQAVIDLIEMGGIVDKESIVKCLRSALSEPEHTEIDRFAYAGITIWGGDAKVTKIFSRAAIEQSAISPSDLVKMQVQSCLNELEFFK